MGLFGFGGSKKSGPLRVNGQIVTGFNSTPKERVDWQCQWCGRRHGSYSGMPNVNGCLKDPFGNGKHHWVS